MIRPEAPGDADLIRHITDMAFRSAAHRSGTESAIVEALRAGGALTLSLVAQTEDTLAGHVAFSPVAIDGRTCNWFGLGPVSVRPDRQRQGIGAALIREGLSRLAAIGAKGCVVLGDPHYYGRFGFEHDPALRFDGAPPEYFLRLTMADGAPAGAVTYHPAFYAT